MTVTARLFARALSGAALPMPADIKLSVNSYSFAAFGGPKLAQLSVSGGVDSLAQAFNWLRCPVEITMAPRQDKIWWGYVSEVRMQLGMVELVMTLDSMSNTVSVAYARVDSGHDTVGVRGTTTDYIDSNSISEYGTKAQRISQNNSTPAQAAQYAANILQLRSLPQTVGPSFGGGGSTPAGLTLHCRGWWPTLGWKFYVHAQDTEESTPPIDNGHKFAVGDVPDRIAQKFALLSPTDSWYLTEALVPIYSEINDWKLNTAYVMYAELYSNAAGTVGTLLATSDSYPPSTFQSPADGYGHFNFSTPYLISGAQSYWLVVRSNIGGDYYWQMRYYWSTVGSPPYARGERATYTSGTWTYPGSSTSIPFKLKGIQDTAKQMQNMVAAAGQFMTSSRLDGFTTSGINTSQYRDGDHTGLAEIEELMAGGTSSNLRILATVTPERQVVFRVEPLPSATPAYQLDKQMVLYDANGNRIGGETCPAGVWIALRNVLPSSASFSRLTAPSPFFAEEGSYDARSGRYTPVPRALGNIFKVGIKQ